MQGAWTVLRFTLALLHWDELTALGFSNGCSPKHQFLRKKKEVHNDTAGRALFFHAADPDLGFIQHHISFPEPSQE